MIKPPPSSRFQRPGRFLLALIKKGGISCKKFIFIPLDERPCNLQYPAYIGAISGLDISFPPRALLGNFKQAANVDGLWTWIQEQAAEATQLVLSLDMFLYGGIVPSRLHHLSADICHTRLNRLRALRQNFPHLRFRRTALSRVHPPATAPARSRIIMRNTVIVSTRYGVIRDRAAVGVATPEELAEWEQIKAEVPAEAMQDFSDPP